MNTTSSQKFCIYGLGAVGQRLVDSMLDQGEKPVFILDRQKAGQTYRDIPVHGTGSLSPDMVKGLTCILTLHNHYVDLHELADQLRQMGVEHVVTLVQFLSERADIPSAAGYWFDRNFDYQSTQTAFDQMIELLADSDSRDIARKIRAYRKTGLLDQLPRPSLEDEYTPLGLPKHPDPVRLIDAGACTGVAIQKFLRAGYAVESVAGFEPDLENFSRLVKTPLNVGHTIFLPLGTWSENIQLHFNANASMASAIRSDGDCVIQCVRVDDVLPHFAPNVIKLDVEGAEIETLLGMEQIIRRHRPNLCISIYHTAGHLHEIPLLISGWNLGYKLYMRAHEFNTFGVVLYAQISQ